MTILIAHRGNTVGPKPELENTLPYLNDAIKQGYDVEVDVWNVNDQFFFGHDSPSIPVELSSLIAIRNYSWFHAKNYDALIMLKDTFNVFFHKDDDYTLTSRGYVWSHNGNKNVTGVVCMPNLITEKTLIRGAIGVCHDYLNEVEQILTHRNTQ